MYKIREKRYNEPNYSLFLRGHTYKIKKEKLLRIEQIFFLIVSRGKNKCKCHVAQNNNITTMPWGQMHLY